MHEDIKDTDEDDEFNKEFKLKEEGDEVTIPTEHALKDTYKSTNRLHPAIN